HRRSRLKRGFLHPFLLALLGVASVVAGQDALAAAARPAGRARAAQAQASGGALRTLAGASQGTAVWRSSSASGTPQASAWDGSSFGSAAATSAIGDLRILAGAEAPTRNEIIAVGVDSGTTTINGEIWDGSAW